jgi:hypothetical protein
MVEGGLKVKKLEVVLNLVGANLGSYLCVWTLGLAWLYRRLLYCYSGIVWRLHPGFIVACPLLGGGVLGLSASGDTFQNVLTCSDD